jgi:hypothetical protein
MDRISEQKELKSILWMAGRSIETILPSPLRYKLLPMEPGMTPHMPEFMASAMPIFRDDLMQALKEIGVNNLQIFDLVITDPDNGKEYTNYKAINIVGRHSVADMDKSVASVYGTPETDVDFDKLILDENKLENVPLMFRLKESVNTILVHKKVKEYLEQKGFDGVVFYKTDQIAT